MKNLVIFKKYLVFLLFGLAQLAVSQPKNEFVTVIVAPDHTNWLYTVGENVSFKITALKDGLPITDISIEYDIKPEQMETTKSGVIKLASDFVMIDGGTLDKPGFLRCWASVNYRGKKYTGYATAGFDPLKIKPTVIEPKDFTQFWIDAKENLAKIPLDSRITLLADRCTEKVNVYHVSIQTWPENARLYGILCVPKARRKYPAVLRVPGAGIRPYWGDIETAEDGAITLEIGIHGIPVNMDKYIYDNLMNGGLMNYWTSNLDNRDNYYYKRVYLLCVRAVDYIYSLPEFDGENLAVAGGSQGGALSIVTAGLDNRVKWLAPYYPALCDLTGYLHGRAGGWPHMLRNSNPSNPVDKAKIETAAYFDVVNFARYVQVPGIYSWGFNDNVCPPTSMYAAYNVIEGSKELFLAPQTAHWSFPEQNEVTNAWLYKKLGLKK